MFHGRFILTLRQLTLFIYFKTFRPYTIRAE